GAPGAPAATWHSWLKQGGAEGKITSGDLATWVQLERGPIEGAGVWSHLYGRPDNAAFGGETLGGASSATDLRVQWMGQPGPRAQADRNGRKPSPLAVGGRLFVQGLHRIAALDAYNGTVLWGLEIPPLQRFNMPRDSSNWCADENHVFAAIKDRCWQVDARTGHVARLHTVTAARGHQWSYDWGYLARAGGLLIGSAVKQESAFVSFWGKADAGWYDARSGPATEKVCSDNLFALDPATGRQRWVYQDGVILNSTITLAGGRAYFIECRHPAIRQSTRRRLGLPEIWKDQHLVALDLNSGRKVLDEPIDTADGTVVFYMAHGGGKLVIVSSGDKAYDVYALDAATGKAAWHQRFDWPGGKGDHGKAMSRPAIVGDKLFVRPRVLNVRTGKDLGMRMPPGGCGTYAATAHALVFRKGSIAVWNHDSDELSNWARLRPGCWLSTVPAGGMLLAPEAGGGCSCGSWMETSVGFIPRTAAP
ncbi:MAG: PQQ-like beta-propeller repeat protein, partial [Phycisphaerae bacterium]|nr:PQQ-like beta-propeller repeat protein [Phycisphaerae bacterium]